MKILVICPNALDATSYYRAWGVFEDIQRRTDITFTSMEQAFMRVGTKKELIIIPGTEKKPQLGERIAINMGLAWPSVIQYDAVFIQRGFNNETLMIARYCKELGLKVIYDIDDNLWELPHHFSFKNLYDQPTLENMDEIVKLSDLITVSTQALKDYIDNRLSVKCEVVNNGWDLARYPIQPYNAEGPTVWRGSATHIHDLAAYRTEIEQMKDIQFWGYNPAANAPKLKVHGYKFIKNEDPFVYFKMLRATKPKYIIVPLLEDLFNECKSNIAWLEVTAAGGVCVSNQHGEFKGKGISFNDNLDANHIVEYEYSKALIERDYNLRTLNDRRIELYRQLFDNQHHIGG